MPMYDDQTSFGDFEFHLDDLLVSRLIDPKVFRTLTGEQYAIIRATVRSELLYSEEVGRVLKPAIGKFVERVRGIEDLRFKVPGGVGLYSSSVPRGGGLPQDVGPGLGPGGPGPGRPAMYGSTFLGFDDILVERWLPAQQLASLKPAELAAFASLVKAEIVYSEAVHAHLKKKIQETLKEITSAKG